MRKKEKRKGSIQSPKDLGIALGTFGVALVVITMITTPVFTSAFPVVVASGIVGNDCCYGTSIVNIFTGDVCCEEIGLLPAGSAIWLCQYIGELKKCGLSAEIWETPHYTSNYGVAGVVSRYFSKTYEGTSDKLVINEFCQIVIPTNLYYVKILPNLSNIVIYVHILLGIDMIKDGRGGTTRK